MKIGGIIKNDFAAAPGVCATVFVQGCPLHCPGCHNPELQSFEGGRNIGPGEIYEALTANNIHRDLCIMGGEPLCQENLKYTTLIVDYVKRHLPDTKIYIWTGYTVEEIRDIALAEDTSTVYKRCISIIFKIADYIIDGPYKQEERDITLKMRGSRNQRIINLKTGQVEND